jgi:hypothetical protein
MSFHYSNKDKYQELLKVSNPDKVVINAIKYFKDPNIKVYLSSSKSYKYMIYDDNLKKVNFGSIEYSDFTKHNNMERRENYLKRSDGIRGNWRDNYYSKNNLSRALLWDSMEK